MYRLTAATGSFTDNNSQSYPFTLAMSYSPSGNITTKNLDAETLLADGSPLHMVYEGNYNYITNQPHTIATITGTDIDMSFQWDQNGNMTAHADNVRSLNRYLCWDEENRLMAVKDQNYLSAYVYDAAGERVWKLSGEVTQMKISGKGTIDVASLNNKTLYVSPYVVYNEQGYSKHYYAGAERVSSRIGGGTMYGLMHPINDTVSPIGTDGNGYPELASRLWGMLQRSFTNCLDLEAGYIGIEHRLNSVEHSAGNDNPEDNWYIYHSDHLGSSSFLTDANGDPTQHLQYLPFGENYIEQRATTDYYTPYTFSAKERDPETGYSYFGARYYDPNVSVWLSVDPMADKYPYQSGYCYVGLRPLMVIDPNGEDEWDIDANGNIVKHIKTDKHDAFFMVDSKGNRIDGKSITFSYGTIKPTEVEPLNGWTGGGCSRRRGDPGYEVSNNTAGAELFKFLADNSVVEYALITTEKHGALVYTNRNTEKVSTSPMADMVNKGMEILAKIHNHPNNSGPSGFRKNETDKDRAVARGYQKSRSGKYVSYYVYQPATETLVGYNFMEVKKPVSFYAVFSKARKSDRK